MQPAASGSGGGAQRQLLLTGRSGRQQQVRNIGAGDQQDEADRAEQKRERVGRAAEERIVERHDLSVRATWFLTARFDHLSGNDRRLCLRRSERDAWLEPADRNHPARLRNLPKVVREPERDLVFPGNQ